MKENKELNNDQLINVSGGVLIGETDIVECENCKTQFDPGTAEKGPMTIEETENGKYAYVKYKCPNCNEFHRVIVIQVKRRKLDKVIYFAE